MIFPKVGLGGDEDEVVFNCYLTQPSIYPHNSRLKQTISTFFWSLQPLKFQMYPL
jgi:hypothetical protein